MFGFNPTNFSDPFDVNKVAQTNNRERAKLKSQTFLTDSELGGRALGTYAQNKAENIMAKAGAAAQRTANNAAGISGLLSAAGSIGSFGAAGGFGNLGGGTNVTGLTNTGLGTDQAMLVPGIDTPPPSSFKINPQGTYMFPGSGMA
jgi:hypothetical protein